MANRVPELDCYNRFKVYCAKRRITIREGLQKAIKLLMRTEK